MPAKKAQGDSKSTRSKVRKSNSSFGNAGTEFRIKHITFKRNAKGRLVSTATSTSNQVQWNPDHLPDLSDADQKEVSALSSFLNSNEGDDEWITEESTVPVAEKPKDNRGPKSGQSRRVKQLADWLPLRSEFLDELLHLEGLGDSDEGAMCCECEKQEGLFRCQDCRVCKMYCGQCLVFKHRDLPTHRTEKWTGQYFQKYDLFQIGVVVQLGHPHSNPCPSKVAPSRCRHFTVIHTNGMHRVRVNFCGCSGSPPQRTQLLRAGWFPTSYQWPQTAITLEALDLFHRLTVQGKLSMYDYYTTLCHKTDGSGVRQPKSRYFESMMAARLYRHLKMLKRAGRGHDPKGIEATLPGQLAVECPACPIPGKNLPDGWEGAPEEKRFLYSLFIALDANFRLKGKNRMLNDISLAPGWAYYVQEEPYTKYIKAHKNELEATKQVNMCQSRLHAIDHANKRIQSYAVSGVGAAKCGRHTIVRPNGVGDLQRGEKYCNMDFVAFSSIKSQPLKDLFLSYDLFCQWSKNLSSRMTHFPIDIALPSSYSLIRGAIPTFHIAGHGNDCTPKYGFALLKGVGRTCGEGVETEWAAINQVATSVREMSPAARQEALNCHWGFWNWRKVVGFGTFLFRKLQEAMKMCTRQRELFGKFTATFSEELIAEWTGDLRSWDAAMLKWQSSLYNRQQIPKVKNPYQETETAVSLVNMKRELTIEEEEAEKEGEEAKLHEMSRTSMISVGLDIEDRQNYLRQHIANVVCPQRKPSASTSASLEEKRTVLKRRLLSWREVQVRYMPFILEYERNSQEGTERRERMEPGVVVGTSDAEQVPLYLPSELPKDLLSQCGSRLRRIESCMRYAQCEDGLTELRRLLRIRHALLQYKKLHVTGTGQAPNTRARALLNRYSEKIELCASRYRRARDALGTLDSDGKWKGTFLALRQSDITFPTPISHKSKDGNGKHGILSQNQQSSEGRREISWIWLVSPAQGCSSEDETTEMNESMRVEWAKSKARVERWEEEVELLVEEMRRVLAYLDWKSEDWRSHAKSRLCSRDILSGIQAYAFEQAHMFSEMADSFAQRWRPLLTVGNIPHDWANRPAMLREEEEEEEGDDDDERKNGATYPVYFEDDEGSSDDEPSGSKLP